MVLAWLLPGIGRLGHGEPNERVRAAHREEADVILDCDTCMVRGDACGDCVVAVLLGPPPALNTEEQRALEVLSASGLVPPLRLAPAADVSDDTPTSKPRAV